MPRACSVAGSAGTVRIEEGGTWTMSQTLAVGHQGQGLLEVVRGRVDAQNVVIANNTNSSCTAIVSDFGEINVSSSVFVGVAGPAAGRLEITTNGKVTAANNTAVGGFSGRTANDRLSIATNGRLLVTGVFVQGAASTYEVNITPTSSGRVEVTGAAQIQPGASLQINLAPGEYPPGTEFVVLSTTDGITGTYQVSTNSPLVTVIQGANNV